MKIHHRILFGLVCAVVAGCGTSGENLADCENEQAWTCEEGDPDERARKAIDAGDLAGGVAILEDLIAAEPETWSRYPLYAAGLAGLAGFDIFNALRAQLGGSGDVFDLMRNFLPSPTSMSSTAYSEALTLMQKSIDSLNTIPAALRSGANAEAWGSSAAFQLTLYQSAWSVMYLNQFAYSAASGSAIDLERLQTMTDADAAAILSGLAAAASSQQGEQGAEVQAAIASAQQAIAAQPGGTDRERLVSWMESRQ
jgi:hypothetical protein